MKTDKIFAAWRGGAECEACSIRNLALFSDLEQADFERIHLPIDDLAFPRGTILYHQANAGRAVFTVRSGLVKLVQSLPNGMQRIVRLARPGDALGLEALLGHPYQHTAEALQPALVCRIPAETVNRLAHDTPRLFDQLMRHWHQSVTQADDWLTLLSTGSSRARLARLFLYLRSDEQGSVCQLFGREDVAAILGVTTETASRMVAELKRERVIAPLPSHRFQCDFQGLEEIAQN